ncbi:MAG TPA: ADOP family duplicated permease [Acidobacteriota bacterium]|nr:ADOP family duplicated permease [Acidobacteriota bacterium]
MELKDISTAFRHSFRSLTRSPSFSFVSVLTVALGMAGILCIIFVLKSVVLRKPPFPVPEKLLMIMSTNRDATGKVDQYGSSIQDFMDWRRLNRSFEQLAALEMGEVAITDLAEPVQVQSLTTTSNLFSLLGVRPQIGRFFVPEEENSTSRVAVISDPLWRRFYGKGSDVIGKTMAIDGANYRIVGVAPPSFRFAVPADIWLPMNLQVDRSNNPLSRILFVAGRLEADASRATATADLNRIAEELARTYPQSNEGWGIKILGVDENIQREIRIPISVLSIGALILLLIACVNVSGLILNRAIERETEIAMRLALGATTLHLFLPILFENLLITFAGTILGFILAAASVKPLAVYGPTLPVGTLDLGLLENLHIDVAAVLIGAIIAVFIALVLTALPLRLSKGNDISNNLRIASKGTTVSAQHGRRQTVLLIMQLTASTLLLAITFGVVKTFWKLSAVSSGFDVTNTAIVKISLPASRYETHEKRSQFVQQFLRQISQRNDVAGAGVTSRLPLNEFSFTTFLDIHGRAELPGSSPVVNFRRISDGYLRTIRASIIEGRDFDAGDTSEKLPVAIVNQKFANTFWPGQSAIGQKIKRQGGKDPWRTIVGVVKDVRELSYSQPVSPVLYVPYSQNSSPVFYCMVRSELPQQTIVSNFRQELHAIDPLLAIGETQSMQKWQRKTLSRPRFTAVLMILLSVVAFTVSLVGVFGNVRGWVLARFREIGVRLACGATHSSIMVLILSRTSKIVLCGILTGMLLTFISAKTITSFFDSKYIIDYAAAFLAGALMATICIASAYLSARSARKISPSILLNQA